MNERSSIHYDENLLYSIIEASPAGMLIVDEEGKIVLANRAAGEHFGYAIEELQRESIDMLIPKSHRSAHSAHRARYMSRPEHRSMAAGRNLFGKRKDGTQFPVDISLHPILVRDQPMVLANVLDATDRRRAEQEREQRLAMERLALLGQLAGGVAHEIRTPLCVIRNDAYFLKMLADQLSPEAQECVAEIDEAVGKAERIVSELLDFTRDPKSERCDVDVAPLIESAIRDAGLPDFIEVVRSGEDTHRVCVDADQIGRVLVNLIRNGYQAMGDSGKIQIQTSIDHDNVVIEVIDDGPGIDPENLHRVFEPLFTTKPKGIGLGLAVSRRYAEQNSGTLTVHNDGDCGACFQLTIPRSHTVSQDSLGRP
ncbi:MAG: two-component system sensor histidine kinase NtrB [Rubripirellula sp.]